MRLAESVNARRRIIAHVGSALTEAESSGCWSSGRQLLENLAQGEFELGSELAAPRTSLGASPRPGPVRRPGLASTRRMTVPVPQVVGTASRVLYDWQAIIDALTTSKSQALTE